MELTDEELRLILAGLFELRITHLESAEMWERTTVRAERLGGNSEAMFFEPRPESH
jgi:hypothetical protein